MSFIRFWCHQPPAITYPRYAYAEPVIDIGLFYTGSTFYEPRALVIRHWPRHELMLWLKHRTWRPPSLSHLFRMIRKDLSRNARLTPPERVRKLNLWLDKDQAINPDKRLLRRPRVTVILAAIRWWWAVA